MANTNKNSTPAIYAGDIMTAFTKINSNHQIKISMDSFKKSSWLVKAIMIALLCMVALSAMWFITYHQIGPLMICMALTVPILCIGIAQQNRTILRIIKEWGEYKNATENLIKLVRVAQFDPETSEKIIAAINWVESESDDIDDVLSEIADTAYELLDAAQEVVESSTEGIIGNTSSILKPNIIPKDETEDLSIRI